MTTQHTPGPWTAIEKFGVLGSVKGGVIRKYTNGTSQDQLFMVCSVQDDNGGTEATNANARLIAAAPDLLEALKEIAADYADRFDLDDPSTNPGIKSTIKQARAAIAKATGEIECKS